MPAQSPTSRRKRCLPPFGCGEVRWRLPPPVPGRPLRRVRATCGELCLACGCTQVTAATVAQPPGAYNVSVIARSRHLPRLVTAAVVLAGLASVVLLASGCGGAASPRVAAISTTTTQSRSGKPGSVSNGSPAMSSGGTSGSAGMPSGNTAGRAAYALVRGSVRQMTQFAACVRSHGEPNFPDPNAQGQFSMSAVTTGGIDPRSPQLGRAVEACKQNLPQSGPAAPSPAAQPRARQQALVFSACMRSHGVPNFPDPPFGGVAIRILPGSGIDPQSPQYQR